MNESVVKATRELLLSFGLDLTDENVKDTPVRVAKMYSEICLPKDLIDAEVKTILGKTFPTTYDGMVISEGIRTYSLCIHHLLPVQMSVVIGYIPTERVVGLSKLARLADIVSKRPLIQENYTDEIANSIMEVLKPKGAGVYVKGLHYCQTMRGAKQQSALMITTSLRGCFKQDDKCRAEFLQAVYSRISTEGSI